MSSPLVRTLFHTHIWGRHGTLSGFQMLSLMRAFQCEGGGPLCTTFLLLSVFQRLSKHSHTPKFIMQT